VRLVARLDPNVALAASAAISIALEAAYRTWVSTAWLLLQTVLAGLALLVAWRNQDRLRLWPVLGIAVGLQLAMLALHLGLDVKGDKDSSVVFRWQGNGVLHGDYPRSEYPAGAVLLFALEAWLGGGTTRVPNALLMAPLQAVAVASIWATRFPLARWLAALVAVWPLNAFFWQYKFDLAPAALLALGLTLAWRRRWAFSGVALALGTLVKWTPALAALAILAWLVLGRRTRDTWRYVAAFVVTTVVVYFPLLLWAPSEVLAAYERQSGRSITPESVWYLLLRPFDLARVRTHISFSAGAPDWADALATVAQLAAVAAIVVIAARARDSRGAIAAAALAPAAFLLTNRIFSPQFVLVLFVAWAFAAALTLESRREQLAVGIAMCVAATANVFVYPFALPRYAITWPLCSAILFGVGIGLTAFLAQRSRHVAQVS
jgi:hypothetical protein